MFYADILIIQECENPKESIKEYEKWTGNYLWIGRNKNKGLGVFSKKDNFVELLNWSDKNINWKNETLELFLPCKINDSIILLGVWTKKANSEVFGYIGQLWKYLQLHRSKLIDEKVVISGDFNSNSIWDRWWNHSDVVNELEKINVKSIYHYIKKEKQGKETKPTFFHQKNIDKPFHIDYTFTSSNLINIKTELLIGKPSKWLKYSDHMPIVFTINE